MSITLLVLSLSLVMMLLMGGQWNDRWGKYHCFGSEYVIGICRHGGLSMEEGLSER